MWIAVLSESRGYKLLYLSAIFLRSAAGNSDKQFFYRNAVLFYEALS